MKVIHITSSIDESAGGPSRSVTQTCEEVSKLGVDITIITKRSKKALKVNTSSRLKLSYQSFVSLLFTGIHFSKKNVDIIHLQHVWSPYIHLMASVAQKNEVPYVISIRGMLEPWIMQRNPLKKKLGLLLYQRNDLKRASVLHATCEMEMNTLRKLGFTNPIAVIPNGINLSLVPSPKESFERKRIIFLSRIHKKKGIELLLDAWKLVDTADWELLIAGEGKQSYEQELKERITQHKLVNVQFVGSKYYAEKWDFIRSGDVFVLPSYSENFGIVVAEALAMGVPVITTKDTPWQELETHQCGWWIELNTQNLSNALTVAMSQSPEQLKAMGLRGRKLIQENYDIRAVAKHMVELYNWIEGKQEQPEFISLE
ncbi:MAG: glycosyltransferase [Paludibacter sp.]|nr:glycosyltransferase [Paludibacter sp.]